MRKTKIICTLGPATDDEKILRKLFLNGMDVARINMSHGTHEEAKARMDAVKKLREELDMPVGILLDTKGPETEFSSTMVLSNFMLFAAPNVMLFVKSLTAEMYRHIKALIFLTLSFLFLSCRTQTKKI